jgi:hypothetical protein
MTQLIGAALGVADLHIYGDWLKEGGSAVGRLAAAGR